jgi:hypothetical protein
MADPAVVRTDAGPVRGSVTDDYRLFKESPNQAGSDVPQQPSSSNSGGDGELRVPITWGG